MLGYTGLFYLIDDICVRGVCHVILITWLFEKWCIVHKLINYLTRSCENRKFPPGVCVCVCVCAAGQPRTRVLSGKSLRLYVSKFVIIFKKKKKYDFKGKLKEQFAQKWPLYWWSFFNFRSKRLWIWNSWRRWGLVLKLKKRNMKWLPTACPA